MPFPQLCFLRHVVLSSRYVVHGFHLYFYLLLPHQIVLLFIAPLPNALAYSKFLISRPPISLPSSHLGQWARNSPLQPRHLFSFIPQLPLRSIVRAFSYSHLTTSSGDIISLCSAMYCPVALNRFSSTLNVADICTKAINQSHIVHRSLQRPTTLGFTGG